MNSAQNLHITTRYIGFNVQRRGLLTLLLLCQSDRFLQAEDLVNSMHINGAQVRKIQASTAP